MQPFVSVILPTYNRAYCLEGAIQSVRKQSIDSWELLVIDDGSTDDTAHLLQKILSSDSRIRSIRTENRKQSAARNTGLEMANGNFITYLDSDNELNPNTIEILSSALSDAKKLYALPQGKRILERLKDGVVIQSKDVTDSEFPSELSIQDIFHRSFHVDLNGFMHHQAVTKDTSIRFDEKMTRMEDWDFIMQIGEKYPDSFLYVPKNLYTYRQRYGGDGAVSNTTYRQWAEIFEYVYQKHKNAALLSGQRWYPDRVKKWNDLADKFNRGEIPSYVDYYFQ